METSSNLSSPIWPSLYPLIQPATEIHKTVCNSAMIQSDSVIHCMYKYIYMYVHGGTVMAHALILTLSKILLL